MGNQLVAAILGFAAGIITAYFNSWLGRRLERHKQVAQLASAAFVDLMNAIGDNAMSNQVLQSLERGGAKEETEYWQRRVRETRAAFASAKARIASYGNAKAAHYLAEIERRGGVVGSDETVQRLLSKVVIELRTELGLVGRASLSEDDVRAILF
jgi:hypothetical protein